MRPGHDRVGGQVRGRPVTLSPGHPVTSSAFRLRRRAHPGPWTNRSRATTPATWRAGQLAGDIAAPGGTGSRRLGREVPEVW